MKRFIFSIALVWLVGLGVAGATNYYVDLACPTAGNGTSATCSTPTTTNNPKKTITDGVALLTTAGDILNIRGIHAAHNTGGENCPGSTDGRYNEKFTVSSKTGSSGAHIIIQAYGWTAVGANTEENVYLEGVAAPGTGTNLGWTKCTDCSAGSAQTACQNVPGVCSEVWYTDTTATGHPSGMTRNIGSVRPDGKPTYRETAIADITSQYDSYSSNSNTAPAPLVVRWGSDSTCTAPATPYSCCTDSGIGTCDPGEASNLYPYVLLDTVSGFDVKGNSVYVEIRGMIIRNQTKAALFVSGGADNIFFIDNTALYIADRAGSGADRAITITTSPHVTIQDNDISCGGSEGIHSEADAAGTVLTIQNNYIHDMGNACLSILGPQPGASPHGMILGSTSNTAPTLDYGDYTGTVIENNFIDNLGQYTSGISCISLENSASNLIIRNNICDTITGTTSSRGIEMIAGCGGTHAANCATNAVNNVQIYNNILSNLSGPAFYLQTFEQSQTVSSNLIYNNTVYATASGASGVSIIFTGGSGFESNLIRNNIFYSSANQKMIDVSSASVSATNLLEYNLISTQTGGGTAAQWRGTNKTCALLSDLGTGNVNDCPSPVFVDTVTFNYHIQTSSPAKDAGTATGMPAGRTRSINNPLASRHGLPQYNGIPQIGSAWDIGACEYRKRRYFNISEFRWKRPEPWRITNASYLRKIEKED